MAVNPGALFPAHPNWILDGDGLPCNPQADPLCKTCKGFGIVDNGGNYGGTYMEDCPVCISTILNDERKVDRPAISGASD